MVTTNVHVFHVFLSIRYTAITGLPTFVEKAIELAYGSDGDILSLECIAATQSISGTGGCRFNKHSPIKLTTF